MSRVSWVFAFVVLAVALCAGWMPVPAAAAAAHRTALAAETSGPDAVLCADDGATRVQPAPRAFAPGQAFSIVAPRPLARVAVPSPVRSGHGVDGLSLPLLR